MWKLVFPVLAALLGVGLGMLVGAPRKINITEPGAQKALDFAVAQHNREGNDMYLTQVARVVDVERQIVAGSMFTITVEMGRTSCRKDSGNAVEGCEIQVGPQARSYTCTFKVWSRPWLSEIVLMDSKC